MATVMQRKRSRRRLAAITFLSNISLDGTHRDTKLSQYGSGGFLGKVPPPPKQISVEEKENIQTDIPPIGDDHNSITFQQDDYQTPKKKDDINVAANDTPMSRFRSDSESERKLIIGKRTTHLYRHLSLHEKPTGYSSSESIGGAQPSSIGGTRQRRNSSTISDSSVPPNKISILKHPHEQNLRDERIVLLTSHKIPFYIFSALPYNKAKFHRSDHQRYSKRERHTSGQRPLSTISDSADPHHILGVNRFEDGVELSYCELLIPTRSWFNRGARRETTQRQNSENDTAGDSATDKCLHPSLARCYSYEPTARKLTEHYVPQSSHVHLDKGPIPGEVDEWRSNIPGRHSASMIYMPNLLDDPELRAGKHRKLLRFSSYMSSVLEYTKPSELKKELNDKFRDKFPHINLTLSKLRSLKREMLKIARQECDIDVLTVAHAYVYFERLILKTIVNKLNRKLIAGACLILSAKMNDVKGEMLTNLIEKTESVFRVNSKDLFQWEFAALVALEFGLHLPIWQVYPHYQRLLFES